MVLVKCAIQQMLHREQPNAVRHLQRKRLGLRKLPDKFWESGEGECGCGAGMKCVCNPGAWLSSGSKVYAATADTDVDEWVQ